MDELSAYFVGQKDFESYKLIMQESKELEMECQNAIEKAQAVIVAKCALESSVKNQSSDQAGTNLVGIEEVEAKNSQEILTAVVGASAPSSSDNVIVQEPPPELAIDPSSQPDNEPHNTTSTGNAAQVQDATWNSTHDKTAINHRLKALKVPTFDGNKKKLRTIERIKSWEQRRILGTVCKPCRHVKGSN